MGLILTMQDDDIAHKTTVFSLFREMDINLISYSVVYSAGYRAPVSKSQTGNTKDALTSGNDPVYEPDPTEKELNNLA